MKKLMVVLAGFVLSTGISFASPGSTDCDDDMQPIVTSMVQN